MAQEAKKIGRIIRELRREKGLKVYELANKIGVNPVYVTQIEKHNKLPSLSVLRKIAKEFNHFALLRYYANEKYPEVVKLTREMRGKIYEHPSSINEIISRATAEGSSDESTAKEILSKIDDSLTKDSNLVIKLGRQLKKINSSATELISTLKQACSKTNKDFHSLFDGQ